MIINYGMSYSTKDGGKWIPKRIFLDEPLQVRKNPLSNPANFATKEPVSQIDLSVSGLGAYVQYRGHKGSYPIGAMTVSTKLVNAAKAPRIAKEL